MRDSQYEEPKMNEDDVKFEIEKMELNRVEVGSIEDLIAKRDYWQNRGHTSKVEFYETCLREKFPDYRIPPRQFQFHQNLMSGAYITGGDGGYRIGNHKDYEEFVRKRNYNYK
jgi:hypothetical protein